MKSQYGMMKPKSFILTLLLKSVEENMVGKVLLTITDSNYVQCNVFSLGQ